MLEARLPAAMGPDDPDMSYGVDYFVMDMGKGGFKKITNPREIFEQPYDKETAFQNLFGMNIGLWPWTSENSAGYTPHLNVVGQRCLAVAASGDQTIDLLLAGAKEVVTFDRSRGAGEMLGLKLQALAEMKWRDVRDFRRNFFKDALSMDNFFKLVTHHLPLCGDGRSVLRNAVSALPKKRMVEICRQHVFVGKAAYWQNEETFRAAQEAVKRALRNDAVSFTACDVRDLPHLAKGKFGAIVLSNILSAILETTGAPRSVSNMEDEGLSGAENRAVEDGLARGLLENTIWPLAKSLTKDGVMQASYAYGTLPLDDDLSENTAEWGSAVVNPTRRHKLFTPRRGFKVWEKGWTPVSKEHCGQDVVTFISRN